MWIDYFNGITDSHIDILGDELSNRNVAITDVIMIEFLQGMRNDNDLIEAIGMMDKAIYRSFNGRKQVMKVVSNYRFLRKHGITIRNTIDVIIATFCIENNFSLLHRDHDFDQIEQYLGLQIVR
jgi:predicted nucleic acid-binding protein